jgi:hypothetical protein
MLAGYVLQQRLGEGGYGTVWKAIGPGGLPKAVKVLRGRFDGQSAETELRALQRMRELRHPFVLSVERIEIIEQQLVIVTELAECSLEDRYESLREGGKRGIPQAELLAYLKDAADALDFMCDTHGLQHLDIKPGNLLIQGGHLKIADFGLIRDVTQTQQSMIAGFTPMYAPPELFDGKPCRFSDQYSLAIVYQTMLTGIPPFSGRTAAQLASQHLRSQPDLSPMSPSERPAISRALSKNPNARFPTCREFVEALARGRTPAASGRTPTLKKPERAETATVAAAVPALSARTSIPVAPQLLGEWRPRPQIVLALGGMATAIAVEYRQMLAAGLPGSEGLEVFPVLALDTDTRCLTASRTTPDMVGLRDNEVLPLPLRDSKDYRNQSERLLEWLSRKWLFNIPRSRQVEGIRPLGRLAFVDHRDAIHRRLTQMVRTACATDALAAASKLLGTPFDTRPEILVLASTQGGSGSGMLHDVAYLARQVLDELSLQGSIVGLMLHTASGPGGRRDVELASTVACLTEWSHYAHQGYRAAFHGRRTEVDRPPFDHAYFVTLGNDLTDEEFSGRSSRVAEYLARGTITAARGFLDGVRRAEAGSASSDQPEDVTGGTTLRSFHLHSTAPSVEDHDRAESLANQLVRRWRLGAQPAAATQEALAVEWAGRLQKELRLELDPLLNMATTVLCSDVGKAFHAFATRRAEPMSPQEARGNGWEGQLQADFQANTKDAPPNQPGLLLKSVAGQSRGWAKHCSEHLTNRLFALTGDAFGVEQADAVIAELLQRLEAIGVRLDQAAASGALAVDAAGSEPADARTADPRMAVVKAYRHWFAAGLIGCLLEAIKEIARTASACRVEFVRARGVLESLEQQPTEAPAEMSLFLDAQSLTELNAFARSLANHPRLSLRGVCQLAPEAGTAWRNELVRDALRFVASEAVKNGVPGASDNELAAKIRPLLWNIGGRHHILSAAPDGDRGDGVRSIQRDFGECVTTISEGSLPSCVLVEMEQLDFPLLVTRLGGADPKVHEMFRQLLTRRDVEWTEGM